MRFLFGFIYLVNAWYYDYTNELPYQKTSSHPMAGGLTFKENCNDERCSGSVKCPDSEKDEVTWKRCTKLKMKAIQEMSPDVVFNFNLPSCIPSGYQVVSMSRRCRQIHGPKEDMSNDGVNTNDQWQSKIVKIENMSNQFDLNQTHFAGSTNTVGNTSGPIFIN